MSNIAIYPGSFDPLTIGHEDLMRRSLHFSDKLIVGVAKNRSKSGLFDVDERVQMIRDAVADESTIEVRAFEGLLADFAHETKARFIVRGLRAVSDFEYEFQMALMNRSLHPDLETIFHAFYERQRDRN